MTRPIDGDPYPLPQTQRELYDAFSKFEIDPTTYGLFSGQGNIDLAEKVAELVNKTNHVSASAFGDGEIHPQVTHNTFQRRAFVINSMYPNPNDRLVETQLLASALRDSGATRVIALVPYLAYARSDRRDLSGSTAGAKVALRGLEVNGVTDLEVLDPHDERILEITGNRTHALYNSKALIPRIARNEFPNGATLEDDAASPDIGGSRRTRLWASQLGISNLIFMHKVRDTNLHDRTQTLGMTGVPGTGTKVLVDDLIATGGTSFDGSRMLKADRSDSSTVQPSNLVYETADRLKQKGQRKVVVAAAHGLFIPDPNHGGLTLPERMVDDPGNCPIDRLYITDSIKPVPIFEENKWLKDRTAIVSCAPILAVAIMCYLTGSDIDERLNFKVRK